jgi:hypothetical protein
MLSADNKTLNKKEIKKLQSTTQLRKYNTEFASSVTHF